MNHKERAYTIFRDKALPNFIVVVQTWNSVTFINFNNMKSITIPLLEER